MTYSSEFAFYGKLPFVGDFISRNMDYAQIQLIDAWLETGFAALMEADNSWLHFYLSAPVWCFNLPAGVWGDGTINGLIMPSVDRVGLYFPFVVLLPSEITGAVAKLSITSLHLAKTLPELLQEDFSPEQVLPFLDAAYETVELAQLEGVVLAIDGCSDASQWWTGVCDAGAEEKFNYSVVPDEALFVRLFGASRTD